MAGDAASVRVAPGQAVRIMAGAPVPEGADGVCMIEETTAESGGLAVVIPRSIPVGEFVRRAGSDVGVGKELGPAHLGVLASQGIGSISVHPRPRVGVLSTGNELADTLDELADGKIRDANRPALLALLRQSGFVPVDLGIDADTVADVLREAQARHWPEFAAVVARSQVWVNGGAADPLHRVGAQDEVAVLPPVSGGC